MSTPSTKRRKTSPTSSLPIQPPTTPSRIPVPRQDARSIRPSFASPTKASLSRHNPQLLPRPFSSQRLGSRAEPFSVPGADSGEDAAQILDEGLRASLEHGNIGLKPQARAASQPLESRGIRYIGRSMSTKPRRMSRSPSKSPSKPIKGDDWGSINAFENNDNPFQKRGLRRSPQGVSAEPIAIEGKNDQEPEFYDVVNPFRKTGLRRSPVPSRDTAMLAQEQGNGEMEKIAGIAVTGSSGLRESSAPQNPDLMYFQQRIESEVDTDVEIEQQSLVKDIGGDFTGRTLRRSPIAPATSHSSENVLPIQDFEQGKASTEAIASGQTPEEESADCTHETNIPDTQEQVSRASPIAPEIVSVAGTSEKELVAVPEQLRQSSIQEAENSFLNRRQRTISPSPIERLFGPRTVEPALHAAAYTQDEPELPLTPTQRGLVDPVVTTPSSGIHNTPSKRAKRNKSIGARLRSSPLKPQAQHPEEPAPEMIPAPLSVQGLNAGKASQRRRSSRLLPNLDPNAGKSQERDDLFRELQQVKADVTLTNRENERIRKMFESGKSVLSAPKNTQNLLDVLLRSVALEVPLLQNPKPKPKSSLSHVQLFLPFSSKRKPRPNDLPMLEKPLPSHLPVSLDDPLPYLQVFAPLSYTSDISILPNTYVSSDTNNSTFIEVPSLQQHHISARSQSGLFAAKLCMTVNTSNSAVKSIEIEKLDLNAEAELGTFLRKRLSDVDDNIEYTLGRDITVLCWAMGRWVEVSILRAQLWNAIELELGTPEARRNTIQKAARKRKRKRTVIVDKEVAADLADNAEGNGCRKWTRRQLSPHMGRTFIEILDEKNHVEVRFEWRMDFDWTGEVESRISAIARMSRQWQQEDDRKSLSKIPETFDRLVLDMGPLAAIRALVGLLMPS